MSGDPSGWVWYGPGQPSVVCGGGIPQGFGPCFTAVLEPTSILQRIEDLERTRVADAARIAVLEAEILEMRTGR